MSPLAIIYFACNIALNLTGKCSPALYVPCLALGFALGVLVCIFIGAFGALLFVFIPCVFMHNRRGINILAEEFYIRVVFRRWN